MEALKVLGKEKVANFEFTGIEGGFGKDKKAMLVTDIARIHGRPVYKLNQLIADNISHFELGLDLIDLKTYTSQVSVSDIGLTKAQWGNAKHIWLASERGYLKLLKIMDDDKAWDIYNDIVDNYFNMRVAIKEKKPELVETSRLQIMGKNAATRKANLIYKIAMATESDQAREHLLAKAAEELTGERYIPAMKHKTYSASQIGKELGISKNKVGRICNELGLKAEKPSQNEYGMWVTGKRAYSDGPADQWLYFEKGKKAIANELKSEKEAES